MAGAASSDDRNSRIRRRIGNPSRTCSLKPNRRCRQGLGRLRTLLLNSTRARESGGGNRRKLTKLTLSTRGRVERRRGGARAGLGRGGAAGGVRPSRGVRHSRG